MPEGYERIYHYHVRKTAGTSLDTAFWALGGPELAALASSEAVRGARTGANGLTFVRHDTRLIAAGDYFYASSHEPAHQVKVPPGTYTVTILRDPAARAISYYRYLKWVREDPRATEIEPFSREIRAESAFMDGGLRYLRSQIASPGMTPAGAVRALRRFRPGQFATRLSRRSEHATVTPSGEFQSFLARVPPRRLQTQLQVFSRSMDPGEAAERVLSCSAVCFTETFSEDLARLAADLGLELEERRERGHGAKVELSDSDLASLCERLAPEYEMIERVRRGLPG
jgi:hypothetical protein